jgi:hypothetical protein
MKINRHITPSRESYENNYTVWSVRTPREWIDELDAVLEANRQSRRGFLGVNLNKQKQNTKEII